jgi:hypothetical protein
MRKTSSALKFIIVFFSLFVLAMVIVTGGVIGGGGGVPYFGARFRPPTNSWYLAYYHSTNTNARISLEHDIFYHGIGDSIKMAKNADILVLGHSHITFGLDWETVNKFEHETSLHLYNMAFASETTSRFFLELIDKHDLRPKVLVINPVYLRNLDFFLHQYAPGTQNGFNAVSGPYIKRAKVVLGANVRFRIENFKHLLMAALFRTEYRWAYTGVAYRNTDNGCWYNNNNILCSFFDNYTHSSRGTIVDVDCSATDDDFYRAYLFLDEMKLRGIKVVFISMTAACTKSTRQISERFNVPYINVPSDELSYCEGVGGHLDKEGAKTLTSRLLNELLQLQVLKID